MRTHRPINISLIEGIKHGRSELDNYESMIMTPQSFAYTYSLTIFHVDEHDNQENKPSRQNRVCIVNVFNKSE